MHGSCFQGFHSRVGKVRMSCETSSQHGPYGKVDYCRRNLKKPRTAGEVRKGLMGSEGGQDLEMKAKR